ncbi:MAG: hypothetical protein NTZ19_15820 [Bacteroidetes bacterium]|nr:hypothetical protein [Bacteroidota bacterium]
MDKNIVPVPEPKYLLSYPPKEDIFRKSTRKVNIEPEDPVVKIISDHKIGDFGLDVPGSELDDADEAIGNEDEENNYYSLGGNDYDDLDENSRE